MFGKLFVVICSFVSLFSTFSNPSDKEKIQLTCHISACGNSLSLFEFDGTAFKLVAETNAKSDSIYVFDLPATPPSFFYIGHDAQKVKPIILGSEKEVIVKGKCGEQFEYTIVQSDLNIAYENLKMEMNGIRAEHARLSRKFSSAQTNDDRRTTAEELKKLDDEKLQLLETWKNKDPYLASIVAVNTYLSFQNNTGDAPNEIFYFAENFFKYANLEDENYNRHSWLFEAFKGYAYTLASTPMDVKRQKGYIDNAINRIPVNSKARKLALSGIIVVLNERKNANFIPFAEQFVNEFKDTDPEATADLQRQIDFARPFTIGGTAPDFEQADPDGKSVKLSDFKGKYLLIDFWASWCGPCRMENPNVVKMYNKYKDLGFEILGVSLDNNKDRWIGAIEQDNLEWVHVSDLKGWKNEVAKMYNITAIPHTILLDKEGKIIARNLRGPSLEEKLKELFN